MIIKMIHDTYNRHFKDGISDNKVKFVKNIYCYSLLYYEYGHTYASKLKKIIAINYGDICI